MLAAGLVGCGASAAPAAGETRPHVPAGFVAEVIAHVPDARELAALPNGDLIVGRGGASIAIVPDADGAGAAGAPTTFATLGEGEAEGVAFGAGFVFAATEHAVWRIPYTTGARSGTAQRIAAVRSGPIAPNSDGDVHTSTSVAISGDALYVGVGSSCNACTETDPTRATIQRMNLAGDGMTTQAKRWRNPIALAVDPSNGVVWAGGAGQDSLPLGHPFEFMDPVSTRPSGSDYGWPDCEENHTAERRGASCEHVVVPALVFPAYSTLIGAAFYPASQGGRYAFPPPWRGGLFVSAHGSWHQLHGKPYAPPRVAFVRFNGPSPARGVNWDDPAVQWTDFVSGYQDASGRRSGRPTGVAVGPNGSLFVADDLSGVIYRIRPAGERAAHQNAPNATRSRRRGSGGRAAALR